jgi:hypothetical protein
MTYKYKARFHKALRKLPQHEQLRVADTIDQVVSLFETHQAAQGLGLKKLFSHQAFGAVFEARTSLSLRLLFSVQRDQTVFHMVGNHDEVRRFIRTFQ